MRDRVKKDEKKREKEEKRRRGMRQQGEAASRLIYRATKSQQVAFWLISADENMGIYEFPSDSVR